MAIEAFAVFADGGYFPNAMTLCVVGAWLCLAMLLVSEREEFYRDWDAVQLSLLGLAVAFWIWTGLSISWSISADQSLIEFNRTGGYVAIFVLGVTAGRHLLCRRIAVILLLAIATAASVYGLGPKTFPSVVENLDEMGRIAVPIGYVNAMGLLMAMGFVLAIYLSSDRTFHWSLRIISAMASPLLLTCLFFTLSRGATLALILGLIVYFSVSTVRLRSFGVMLLSLVPTVLIAMWSSGQDALMKDRVPMSERIVAASTLRWYVVASVIAAGLIFTICIILGRQVKVPQMLSKGSGALILASVILLALGGAIWFTSSKPSFSDWSRQAYHDLRYGAPSNEGTGRLLEMGSSGRWKLWEESLESWEEHPYLGSGGQSFPLVHLLKRDSSSIFVKQPHSHPFQLLAEFGIVGFLLGMAFITVAMTFSTITLCRQKDRWERSLAAAILSMLVIYLIHASYDWDWNMFALTMAFFYFSGIMLGWPRPRMLPRSGRIDGSQTRATEPAAVI
ncbi:MAG: O-antigen ligase family protein [Actinobacteria bacterium]|nr:O-antigen ligase family protein [Actinomycetota bacterium]